MPHKGHGDSNTWTMGWMGRIGSRRILATLLACAMLCGVLPASVSADGETMTANGHVYLREGPATTYRTVLVLKPNAELRVLSASGDWYNVSYGRKKGYVRKDVVTPKGATPAKTTDNSSSNNSAAAALPTTYRTLKLGMTGDDVFKLHEGLIYTGYLDRMPDRKYGEDTKVAVTNYQKANKLKADGVAGEDTQRKLFNDPAAAGVQQAASQPIIDIPTGPANPTSYTAASPGDTLKLGMAGAPVRMLQSQLQTLGYLSGNPDGSFGVSTYNAVVALQNANNLKADGVVGSSTQKAINTALAKRSADATDASGQNTASADTSVLKEGVKSEAVKQMQTALQKLGYYSGGITGNFGPITGQAVKSFQRANNLDPDGIAGPSTLNKIFGGSAVAHNGKPTDAGVSINAAGSVPRAASVQHTGMSTIRSRYKSGTIVTIYDFHTKLTWKCRFYSMGLHADSEPLTAADTDIMYRAFGNQNTWTAKAVWVTTPDGNTYIASMHNMPHLSGSIKENNFPGHLCIHFPRSMEDATKTGPYAVSHQEEIIKGWAITQQMAGR